MDNKENKGLDEEKSNKRSPFDDLSRDELIAKCKGLLVLAQRAKQAKSDYQLEVDKYKNQTAEWDNEKKGLLTSIKTLQELVDSLTEQKLNYITEIDKEQNKLKSIEDKCCNYEEAVKKYKDVILERDHQLATSLQKISDLDSEIISIRRQNNRLMEENEQLINQMTELEASTSEFNKIGLQQREQLQMLEQRICEEFTLSDSTYSNKIDELSNTIKELESDLEKTKKELLDKDAETKIKLDEINMLYETEKSKKDKANIKLKSYKDKILRCASCINQLKNARYILTKTIKEYSENIPKWQDEIRKASLLLDAQMNDLNKENLSLKTRIEKLEEQLHEINTSQNNVKSQSSEELILARKQINDLEADNMKLKKDLDHLTSTYEDVQNITENENKVLKDNLNAKIAELDNVTKELQNLHIYAERLEDENEKNTSNEDKNANETLILQIKALESEKSILVKEKLSAKENVIELDNMNKSLNNDKAKLKKELDGVKIELERLSKENIKFKEVFSREKDQEVKQLEMKFNNAQSQYENLKKEFENLQDMNGLLREEIETLKFSLEQPNDETENLSDVNASLQADLVKIETKLSAYKQENATLLAELKDCRSEMKAYDEIVVEYEDSKSKLLSYKTENNELLNEMKEINHVLKERGETISKLQKAVSEMETLIETLEKEKDEKQNDLMIKINALENNLKSAEFNTNKRCEDNEKLVMERDNAVEALQEKDGYIASLEKELERLKAASCNAMELPNEDMSTSTISKAEEHSRMKDLDESFEDKYTKLRIFAVKLKKKLNETILQLQTSDQENVKLKKLLDQANKSVDEVDSKETGLELESQIKSLTSDVERLEADLTQKTDQLKAEVNAHASTRQQLEKALRDVKKKNVLSLEMEDYEKSMKDLTNKMEENKKKIIQMESTIDTQEGTITAMKTQIKLLEEQIKSEETENRHLREELQQTIQDSKEKDNVINAKREIIEKLVQDSEDEKRRNEDVVLEITTLLSEKEKVIMNLGEERVELNNKMKKIEFKCGELDEKLRITNIELADLKTEYTSYKVRAQAVLRQNQTIDHSQEEQLKEETAALKAQNESLNTKLNTLHDQYTEQSAELEATRKRAVEAGAEASRAQQRTARLQSDLTRLSQQLESERSQHKLQISTLTQCYKSQITDLEAKLQKESENLRKQIAIVQESAKYEEDLRDKFVPIKDDSSDVELDINVSMIPREEGEGSESAPSPPLSKSFLTAGRRSPVPLDRLLEDGVAEDDTLDTSSLSLTPEQEILDLKRKVLTLQQRVKHVTVLLSESEREGARMVQLSELLKAELRRVRGATQHAHNTEYMKNVTLKFLTLPPGDERSRLVPVLQKILTLSSEESQKIQALAKGLDPNPSKGWGSYLPWPGGK
ncbi:GRIP and coiled-coil domain-containing protein 2 isoform X1 [Pieris brassicae]|uniref:GRIP and coiled-coil domain-containing protein 2 isoform X1 n=1 Tax=Pieris brassicae TaxID=7116 RepID=UPI001E661C0F|nr:GRIP and coiled-coil domain-containing protein 2 isoform X1 [Pieris brassicae]